MALQRDQKRYPFISQVPAVVDTCSRGQGPEWCKDPIFDEGMCRRHQKRAVKMRARCEGATPAEG